MSTRQLIRYAGWEPPNVRVTLVPVDRAEQMRARGWTWKQVARELTDECDREVPFTADGVHAAVMRERKKRETVL